MSYSEPVFSKAIVNFARLGMGWGVYLLRHDGELGEDTHRAAAVNTAACMALAVSLGHGGWP